MSSPGVTGKHRANLVSDDSEDEEARVRQIQKVEGTSNSNIYIPLLVNGKKVRFLLDTGSGRFHPG